MATNIHESSFKPYFKHIFWPLTGLAFVFVLSANIALYTVSTRHLFQDIRTELQQIATNIAANVPVDVHERLTDPEQQQGADYKQIESYFQAAMNGNPLIDDIYTLRPTATSHQMMFVVSGMETADANHNGQIDDIEQKPALGELYDTAELPDLERGLINAAADQAITYDKWGSWISGYAPIRDDHGQSIAIVGVDYQAQYFIQQRWDMLRTVLIVGTITFIVCVVVIYILSLFFIKPFRHLAHGMSKVAHGDFTFRMPPAKGDEETYNHLFNNMMNVFDHSLANKKKEDQE